MRVPRRDVALSLVAPLLLIAIAGLQVVRVQTMDQSSWSGAGFGMFATIDNETYRLVRGYTVDADGERAVGLPGELREEAFELRVVPSASRAAALGQRWREKSGVEGDEFVVEVWRVSFDPEGPSLSAQPLLREVLE